MNSSLSTFVGLKRTTTHTKVLELKKQQNELRKENVVGVYLMFRLFNDVYRMFRLYKISTKLGWYAKKSIILKWFQM